MARDFIIPVFIANRSCPGACVFCRVKSLVGEARNEINAESLEQKVRAYLSTYRRQRPGRVQLAFYGGSFTALAKNYQREMLDAAQRLYGQGLIDSIRLSTRPDCLGPEELDLLAAYPVRTVEVGAQSLRDEVLIKSGRGHTAGDVVAALSRLKERGFETGIHLMAGLPGDSREGFIHSLKTTVHLKPDFVRLHPTVVLAETPLAEAYFRGEYRPLSREEAIWAGRVALVLLGSAGIPLARLGLQVTEELSKPGVIIAGYYHPALRSQVEESLFFDMAASLLLSRDQPANEAEFFVSAADVANFIGERRTNILRLRERFGLTTVTVGISAELTRGSLAIKEKNGTRQIKMDSLPGIM